MDADAITPIQSLANEMLLRALGMGLRQLSWNEYIELLDRVPKSLKCAHALINDELAKYSQTEEFKQREFTRFKAGHKIVRYERYPNQISRETVRLALVNFGWRSSDGADPKLLFSRTCANIVDAVKRRSYMDAPSNAGASNETSQAIPSNTPA